MEISCYSVVDSGRCSDVTMVNSSWTEGHIAKLWGGADAIQKV